MGGKEVRRDGYLRWLEQYLDNTRYVKVIQGVRRCGKSTLLRQFSDVLRSKGVPDDRIIMVNMESAKFRDITDDRALTDYLYGLMEEEVRYYVFLDEVQRVDSWERAVAALRVDRDADIYVTGSNSSLLASELATLLAGRYVSIQMLPLSFSEFCELRGDGEAEDAMLEAYMVYGGFPGVDPRDGRDAALGELEDLYASIVLNDIAERGGVRNVGELRRILRHMMENIGNPVSLNAVATGLGDCSRNTVDRYLELMIQAYVLYRADRFDVRSDVLAPHQKFYAVDVGLRTMAVGYEARDWGRLLENIVYLELLRRGYKVTVGVWGSSEVDFVARKPGGVREYFQVCHAFQDEKTEERELAPLRAIRDSFPKTVVLRYGGIESYTRDGIRVVGAAAWLLDRTGRRAEIAHRRTRRAPRPWRTASRRGPRPAPRPRPSRPRARPRSAS